MWVSSGDCWYAKLLSNRVKCTNVVASQKGSCYGEETARKMELEFLSCGCTSWWKFKENEISSRNIMKQMFNTTNTMTFTAPNYDLKQVWSGKPEEEAKSTWQPSLPRSWLQRKHWRQGEVAGDRHVNDLKTKRSHWQLIAAGFKSTDRHSFPRRRTRPQLFFCLVSRLHGPAVVRSLIVRGIKSFWVCFFFPKF